MPHSAGIQRQQGKFGVFRTWCGTIGSPYGHKIKIDPGDRINSRWLRNPQCEKETCEKTVKSRFSWPRMKERFHKGKGLQIWRRLRAPKVPLKKQQNDLEGEVRRWGNLQRLNSWNFILTGCGGHSPGCLQGWGKRQLLVLGKAGLCGESQANPGLVSSKLHKRHSLRKQVQIKHKTPQKPALCCLWKTIVK